MTARPAASLAKKAKSCGEEAHRHQHGWPEDAPAPHAIYCVLGRGFSCSYIQTNDISYLVLLKLKDLFRMGNTCLEDRNSLLTRCRRIGGAEGCRRARLFRRHTTISFKWITIKICLCHMSQSVCTARPLLCSLYSLGSGESQSHESQHLNVVAREVNVDLFKAGNVSWLDWHAVFDREQEPHQSRNPTRQQSSSAWGATHLWQPHAESKRNMLSSVSPAHTLLASHS